MNTQRQKMLTGQLYNAADPELLRMRENARILLRGFNVTAPDQHRLRFEFSQRLFGAVGEGLLIEPPFFCDYGTQIHLGHRVFFNFNCVVLDPAPVNIGDDVLIGPSTQIYTATHPLDARLRRQGLELAKPVTIGSNAWIGGGSVICPGVTIGEGTVVGAGAVVTRDLPPYVVAAGNPCRVIRALEKNEANR